MKSDDSFAVRFVPSSFDVQGTEGRRERWWALRLRVRADEDAERVSRRLHDAALNALRSAAVARGLGLTIVGEIDVEAEWLSEKHLLLRVETSREADENVEADLVCSRAAVMELEREYAVEDIQGLPRRLWRLLFGPPVEATASD